MDDLPEILRLLRRIRRKAKRMPDCCRSDVADVLAVMLDAYANGNLHELAAGVMAMDEDFCFRAASPNN